MLVFSNDALFPLKSSQLPKIMELVGLGYTGWFVYRYLLFKVYHKIILQTYKWSMRYCKLSIYTYICSAGLFCCKNFINIKPNSHLLKKHQDSESLFSLLSLNCISSRIIWSEFWRVSSSYRHIRDDINRIFHSFIANKSMESLCCSRVEKNWHQILKRSRRRLLELNKDMLHSSQGSDSDIFIYVLCKRRSVCLYRVGHICIYVCNFPFYCYIFE